MQFVEETPDRLILRDRALGTLLPMGAVIVAILTFAIRSWRELDGPVLVIALGVAAALAAFLATTKWTDVAFDREADEIRITRRGIWTRRDQSFALSNLKTVDLDSQQGKNGMTHRVQLHIQGEVHPIPLTHFATNGFWHAAHARRINAWLSSNL